MNITSGEVAGVVAMIGTGMTFLGITGVDATVVNNAVNGLIAIVTFVSAVWIWWKHRALVSQTP
jgi:uncharacterized iron-regulated membrane protein